MNREILQQIGVLATMPNEVERIKRTYHGYAESGKANMWSATNAGNTYAYQERLSTLLALLSAYGFMPLAERHILDVGCGTGGVLANFIQWGANPDHLVGIDLLEERIALAKKRHPNLRFELTNAERLQFEDQSFDLVLYFTVFSSILDDAMAHNVAAEGARVLKSGGAIVWYDFRYPSYNRNTRPLRRQDIQRLFPGFALQLQSITLAPPISRRLGKLTNLLYTILSVIPLLRTHYLGLIIKP